MMKTRQYDVENTVRYDDENMIVQWWKRDGTMIRTRRYDDNDDENTMLIKMMKCMERWRKHDITMIKTRWHDDEIAMIRWYTMIKRRRYNDTIKKINRYPAVFY